MPQVNEISWLMSSFYYVFLLFISFMWFNFFRESSYFKTKFNLKFFYNSI